ncbi:MAG: transcriptional repressor [Candidatus Levybacteria bacterium]|nr:transcriptional repressor [Candidatus Levybacteria bacterium]
MSLNAYFKKTKGRDAVIKILQSEDAPVDAAHIYEHLVKKHVSINQATLYRILDFFTDQGMIDRFEFQEGKQRFEIVRGDHHHLICEMCGCIEDIEDCNIKDLEKDITKKKKFLVKRHSLEFYGVCQSCQR